MIVRKLEPDDWTIFRRLRLAGLQSDPTSFATSYEGSLEMSDEEWRDFFGSRDYFVAFDEEEPVGMAAIRRDDGESFAHRAVVLNVYVSPSMRGRGVGEILMSELANHAMEQGILQLELGVNAESTAAIRLYERNGYTRIGTMPRGFRVGGKYYDEIYMIRLLDRA